MKKVALDYGHGGDDQGTCENGLVESEVARQIGEKVKSIIEETKLVELFIVRPNNETMNQGDRGRATKEAKVDAVFSIHINHAGEGPETQDGLMVFHYPGNHRTKDVAEQIARSSPAASRHGNPVWSTNAHDWRVDAHTITTAHDADTILVESGFASNPGDAARLMTEAGQWQVAYAIASGIARWFELVEVGGEKPIPEPAKVAKAKPKKSRHSKPST